MSLSKSTFFSQRAGEGGGGQLCIRAADARPCPPRAAVTARRSLPVITRASAAGAPQIGTNANARGGAIVDGWPPTPLLGYPNASLGTWPRAGPGTLLGYPNATSSQVLAIILWRHLFVC